MVVQAARLGSYGAENWISPFSPCPKLSVFLWEGRSVALPCFLFAGKFCFLSCCGGLNEVVAWQRQNVNILYKYTSCDPGTILVVFPNVSGRSAPTFAAIALSYSIDVIYETRLSLETHFSPFISGLLYLQTFPI